MQCFCGFTCSGVSDMCLHSATKTDVLFFSLPCFCQEKHGGDCFGHNVCKNKCKLKTRLVEFLTKISQFNLLFLIQDGIMTPPPQYNHLSWHALVTWSQLIQAEGELTRPWVDIFTHKRWRIYLHAQVLRLDFTKLTQIKQVWSEKTKVAEFKPYECTSSCC